jgi:hypothetical protein
LQEKSLKQQAAYLITLFLLGSVVVLASEPAPRSADAPRVFVLDGIALQHLRDRVGAGDLRDPALDKLRSEADHALQQPLLSVTQKQSTPPSGDKHDYMSLAPYWWPDPKSPTGLPYIRRDGETNPEIQQVQDHKNFSTLMSATQTLALAYYLFGDERYAGYAAELLRAWFLNPATHMNPNLTFAQAVRGHNDGRGTGLIETRGIGRVVDAVGLLAGSHAWTDADQRGMQEWCSKFLTWMQESANGRQEADAKNNHGTYYDVQIAALALFTGKTDVARRVVDEAGKKRIAVQIEADGRQPLELARTKSFGYSAMNLAGLFELARLGDSVGADLWRFQTSDGRSIRKALDFLVPFAAGDSKWTYPQIAEFKAQEIVPPLLTAADKYGARRYERVAAKIDPGAPGSLDALLIKSKKK